MKQDKNKEEKRIRRIEWMERLTVVTIVCLCVALIMKVANREWLDGATCALWMYIAYLYNQRFKSDRVLLQYAEVLEAERKYHEKRIEVYEELCKKYEERIENLLNEISALKSETHTFIPSEGE